MPPLIPISIRFLAFVVLSFSLFIGSPALGREFTGQVVGVIDGDTISVLHDGKGKKIRLHGIDTPERGQPFGKRAKHFTVQEAFRQHVTIIVRDQDRYGRTVGEVILPDGRSLNEELVREGFAMWYSRYSNDPILVKLERGANEAKRGLWVSIFMT